MTALYPAVPLRLGRLVSQSHTQTTCSGNGICSFSPGVGEAGHRAGPSTNQKSSETKASPVVRMWGRSPMFLGTHSQPVCTQSDMDPLLPGQSGLSSDSPAFAYETTLYPTPDAKCAPGPV